jgi:hypothetical protein
VSIDLTPEQSQAIAEVARLDAKIRWLKGQHFKSRGINVADYGDFAAQLSCMSARINAVLDLICGQLGVSQIALNQAVIRNLERTVEQIPVIAPSVGKKINGA